MSRPATSTPKASREVLDILTGLNKSGHTIVLITHDPNVASVAERVVEMADGRLQGPGDGMSLLRTFETGMRGLLGHRLRSVLTTLGILFGVAAVICTVGIGTASADSVNSRIAALGTNLLTVSPGSTVSFGVRGGAGSANTLTMERRRRPRGQVRTPPTSAQWHRWCQAARRS